MFKAVCIAALALAAVIAVLNPVPAQAGYHDSPAVTIDDSTRRAAGSIGGTHNSTDVLEMIGCGLTAWPDQIQVDCAARDSAGRTARCSVRSTAAPAIAQAAAAIGSSSYVSFMWDKAGICTQLVVDNSSLRGSPALATTTR